MGQHKSTGVSNVGFTYVGMVGILNSNRISIRVPSKGAFSNFIPSSKYVLLGRIVTMVVQEKCLNDNK